ncbi:MAG: glycosyl transferase [Clostridia bacterium]|nr:glycosyl transferase [Clostridia bacterium]
MIPKIIHYCWFGNNEMPEKIKFCINSWKSHLKDYEFILWNEKNFNLDIAPFVRQAYDRKKYAFVSDYVRIYALKTHGGFYLDTDIEVKKTFNDMLDNKVILGTDDQGYLTAFMASEPNHPFFQKLLYHYNKMQFLNDDGTMNTEVNNTWLQENLTSFGYKQKNTFQNLNEGIVIYPCEYFHAKSLTSGKLLTTKNTYCIHHHTLLWVSKKTKLIRFFRMKILVPLLGAERYAKIVNWIRKKQNEQ